MSGTRHYKKRTSHKYSVDDVKYWREIMRTRKWNAKKLSEYLEIPYQTIAVNLQKEALGELQ